MVSFPKMLSMLRYDLTIQSIGAGCFDPTSLPVVVEVVVVLIARPQNSTESSRHSLEIVY